MHFGGYAFEWLTWIGISVAEFASLLICADIDFPILGAGVSGKIHNSDHVLAQIPPGIDSR